MLIPKSTEEAHEIGQKLSLEEILVRWEEYKRSLRVSRKERLSYLRDCERGRRNLEFPKEMLKKSFLEQMLRETVEGYLGTDGGHSLTREHIEKLLKKGRANGTVSSSTDRKSL